MNDASRASEGNPPSTTGRVRKLAEREAAEWLALREARPFTPAEHASFADWRAASTHNAEAFAEIEIAWRTFDQLAAYPHSADRASNPDLLAPTRPRKQAPVLAFASGLLAASLAVAALFWLKDDSGPEPSAAIAARHLRLHDGSSVELNAGAKVIERYTADERRVLLVQGEAHFAVTSNPARPFVVEAGGVAVKAVGTAFNVRMESRRVEVLVTEGEVQVAMAAPPLPRETVNGTSAPDVLAPVALDPVSLLVGQRTIIEIDPDLGLLQTPVVDRPAAPDIDRMLAWQAGRFIFDSTPLRDAIVRFNELDIGPRLIVGDDAAGAVLVSGRIRAENLESFVEVLETGFGVTAETLPSGEIVLRRRE